MEQKLTKAFQNAKYETNTNLADNIWHTISVYNEQKNRVKLWVFSSFGLASFIGIIPAFRVLLSDLAQSGFYEYFSLIFSDSGSVISYWKELVSSLAESLPTTSIMLTLTLIFTFFLSARYAMKQVNNNQLLSA